MKQLTCEMCGSTELLKQDGVFICQSCGCKYSVEEAKKMMVEGTVDVTGSTVKVDSSEKLNNLYTIARRAKDDNNSEKAAQYYDMILQEDPMSWEASFYTTYYSAMQTNIAGIQSATIKVNNCIDTVLMLILNNVSDNLVQISAITEIIDKVQVIGDMLYDAAERHYDEISNNIKHNYRQDFIDRATTVWHMLFNLGDQIEFIFKNDPSIPKLAIVPWELGIIKCNRFINKFGWIREENIIKSYTEKIGKYDSKYKEDYDKKISENEKNKEIDNIKSRIDKINGTIAATNTTGEYKFNGCGIFLLVVGGIMFILSSALYSISSGEASELVWMIPVGLVEIIAGIFIGRAGKPSAAKVAANIEEVKKLNAEKAELRKKLAELENDNS